MENFAADTDADIGRWLSESPRQEWVVFLPDGGELCRHHSESAAQEALARIAAHFGSAAAGKCVLRRCFAWPGYVAGVHAESAESRFCRQALRELGYVTIFGFGRAGDEAREASFLVVSRDGRRAEGETLSAALAALMQACGIGPWGRPAPAREGAAPGASGLLPALAAEFRRGRG